MTDKCPNCARLRQDLTPLEEMPDVKCEIALSSDGDGYDFDSCWDDRGYFSLSHFVPFNKLAAHALWLTADGEKTALELIEAESSLSTARATLAEKEAEIAKLRIENDGYRAGFDTQHAEIERLTRELGEATNKKCSHDLAAEFPNSVNEPGDAKGAK